MKRHILLVLFTLFGCCPSMSGQAADARDIDQTYEKPGNQSWGQAFGRLFKGSSFNKSHALVIGVGDYDHWPRLEAPYRDAIRMRDFLINKAGFDTVVTLTNAAATKARIDKLMQEEFPNRVGRNDRFLFYFSGHGTQRPLSRGKMIGYLPLKTAERDGYAAMISMDDVERWSRLLAHAQQSLFVLDACFSGLAGAQLKGPLTDKTLERLTQYGHHLITAGTANEESVASLSRWGGSLFTDAFLRGAQGRADASTADYPADGLVSLKELVKYIEDMVAYESRSAPIKMSPQISNLQYDNAGEFFFAVPNANPSDGRRGAEGPFRPEVKGAGIETMDVAMRTVRTANVREGPTTGTVVVATLSPETPVQVIGRVRGEPWFRVALEDGRTGYMWEKLLAEGTQVAVGRYPSPTLTRRYELLETFKDCDECPEMVVIPAGTFMMGSPQDEKGRSENEGPQHRVTIERFAIGRDEVTFDQWDACVAAGGCNGYEPYDQGWGGGDRPVINVSWDDAQAYVDWLSDKTGKDYRLPTEAEWEYAARAGTTTPYAFGESITSQQANFFSSNVGKTTEVGRYPANAWGLRDMDGNVWEWVEDCYHDSYQGAPRDGSAWADKDCRYRVVRGGSWYFQPEYLRSADRDWYVPGFRDLGSGFRVARTLTP